MARGSKARERVTVQQDDKTRYALVNPKVAWSSAKGLVTRSINRGPSRAARARRRARLESRAETAGTLKEGVVQMAERIGVGEEQMEKLERMDENKLMELYDSNRLIFDVYFSYHGIDYEYGYGYIVDEDRIDEVDMFIEQYERLFGEL